MAKTYLSPEDDPAMVQAKERARQTFKYFWRELSWEARRIVPGLSLACVKAPFTDPGPSPEGGPNAEEMWLNDVGFDGRVVSGTLINSPDWLKSVKEGDHAEFPLSGISDWMYAIGERVYGAFTVNVIRSQMSRSDRADHDAAWGLDFGDPEEVQVVPPEWYAPPPSFFQKLLGKKPQLPPDWEQREHPMAANMGESLEQHLKQDPSAAQTPDERGWTLLHQLALAGTPSGVEIVIRHGGDVNARTADGMTPLMLANSLQWSQVAEVLKANGAQG